MRTSKKNFEEQMAAMDMRDQRIRDIEHQLQLHDMRQSQLTESSGNSPSELDEDSDIPSNIDTHHVIGISQRDYIDIGPWLLRNQADPAIKVYTFSSLCNFLTSCTLGLSSPPTRPPISSST